MNEYTEVDYIEYIRSICGSELNVMAAIEFAELLNIGTSIEPTVTRSAISYVTVFCETDYIFSAKELEWISHASEVLELDVGDNRSLVIVKIECDLNDYYIYCAALVKLLSQVKNKESLFLFVLDNGIAFGCNKNYNPRISNSFCVSSYINVDYSIVTLEETDEEFLDNLMISEWEDYPQIISDYSPNEQLCGISKYDQLRFDPNYIMLLGEVASKYGVDTAKQVEEYNSSFEDKSANLISYRDTSKILSTIGTDTKTSYEVLEAVEAAEKKTQDKNNYREQSISKNNSALTDAILQQYTDEAFDDAELLLKEVMKKND